MLSRIDHLAGALLLSGCGLLISPWLLGFAAHAAPTISASIIAAGLLVLFFCATSGFADQAYPAALGLGAWSMVSPTIFNFPELGEAFWAHVTAGALAMLISIVWHDRTNRAPIVRERGRREGSRHRRRPSGRSRS